MSPQLEPEIHISAPLRQPRPAHHLMPVLVDQRVLGADVVWYGPQPCGGCERLIIKASHQQGGLELEQPDGPIYPNTQWAVHVCPERVYPHAN